MATDYEEARKTFREWDVEELKFGLWWVISNVTEENFDENLITAYLDAIEEKLPPMPLPDKYESYEKFRKKVFEKYGMQLPPMEREADQ